MTLVKKLKDLSLNKYLIPDMLLVKFNLHGSILYYSCIVFLETQSLTRPLTTTSHLAFSTITLLFVDRYGRSLRFCNL